MRGGRGGIGIEIGKMELGIKEIISLVSYN
jgi:hypothetical protein